MPQARVQAIRDQKYNLVIVEEAGLIHEAAVHLAIATKPNQIAIVGDERQMKA